MDRESAIEKVKKLMALQREGSGATVGEIASAACMAQRLIDRFNIDEECLKIQENTPAKPEDVNVVEATVFEFDGPRVLTWALNLVGALGDVNGCKVWYSSMGNYRGAKGKLRGCGREADLDGIRYMMSYLTNEIERLCKDASRRERESVGSCSKTWTNSFKLGAVSEVSHRIREDHKKMREEMRDPSIAYRRAIECGDTQRIIELDNAPKYELAVIDNALSKLDDRKKRAEEWANKQYTKWGKGIARSGAKSGGAYNAGKAAGRTINLSNNTKRLS